MESSTGEGLVLCTECTGGWSAFWLQTNYRLHFISCGNLTDIEPYKWKSRLDFTSLYLYIISKTETVIVTANKCNQDYIIYTL